MEQYFDVDVRHVEYGVVKVKAKNQEEAIKKVKQATGSIKMKESWISVEMEPIAATQSVASLEKEIGEDENCIS